MTEAYAFTICKVADAGRIAAKRICGKDDGSFETIGYDRITRWLMRPKEVSSNVGMAALLNRLATRTDLMIVMGAVRPGRDLSQPQLRRWADPDPSRNTLVASPVGFLAIDVDGYSVPEPWGRAEHVADAARCVRDDALGDEFAGVECVVAATASTGLAGEDVARLRLFFPLEKAHPLADLRRWAIGAQAVGAPVDPAVLQAGQPIYTARPIFHGCLRDPVPERVRAFVLPGRSEPVALDVHRHDRRAGEIEAYFTRRADHCGDDWRRLLVETLGGPASFFVPLTRALGIAARSADDEAEVVAFTTMLLTERADQARLRQYGPRWLVATLRRFRRFDHQVVADIAQRRRQLFSRAERHG